MTLLAARVRGITSSGRVQRNRRQHQSDPRAPAGACIENGNCLVERWNPASIPVQHFSFRREPTGMGSYSPQESNLIANSSLEPMQRYSAISPECTAISVHAQVNLSLVQRHPTSKSPWCARQALGQRCLAMLLLLQPSSAARHTVSYFDQLLPQSASP